MIKRAEVEHILRGSERDGWTICTAGGDAGCCDSSVVAELCRTWLAVADAPEGTVSSFDTAGAWMVDKDDRRGIYTPLRRKRVKLVPVDGGDGNG